MVKDLVCCRPSLMLPSSIARGYAYGAIRSFNKAYSIIPILVQFYWHRTDWNANTFSFSFLCGGKY